MDLLYRFLYLVLGSSAIFYCFVKISLSYWKKRGIRHEKPKFFWGNLKGVGKKRHVCTVLEDIYKKHKNHALFVGCFALLKPLICILDTELAQRIVYSDSENYFEDRGIYNNVGDDPLSWNLMQLDGQNYAKIQKKCQSPFDVNQTNKLFNTLKYLANNFETILLAEKSTDTSSCNISKLIQAYNMDCASLLGFGLECNSLQNTNTEFIQMAHSCIQQLSPLKAYLSWNYPTVARLLQYRIYNETASDYFIKLVSDKLKQESLQRSPPEHMNFVHLFNQIKRSSSLSSKQIAAQCFSYLLVGIQACNSALVFCLYELALQSDLQDKARKHIFEILAKYNNDLSLECINEMKYLKQVLQETLRKHTPYAFLLRRTTKDFEVPNSVFLLQKNNDVIIPISAIHKDEQFYPQPDKFDPERFSSDNVLKRPKISFIPYGGGHRQCTAQQFAETQMLVALVVLLRSFKFSPCADTAIPLTYNNAKIVLTPSIDIKLQISKIS